MTLLPTGFSAPTLAKFEDACASIPLRQLDRAFTRTEMHTGDDPGGPPGARRVQFRRYIATVDQSNVQHVERLGAALGALIAEVAASKQDFLVSAAERDGFVFADGVFRPAPTAPASFAMKSHDDLTSIEVVSRQLQNLVDQHSADAISGAREYVQTTCRTVLQLSGQLAVAETVDLVRIVGLTFDALAARRAGRHADGSALTRRCLVHLGAVVAAVAELSTTVPNARLAAGAAITLATFFSEMYLERFGDDG